MDHILVVDDDPNIRQLLGDYLRSMGYQATTATSGAQMKQIIKASQIDLVVLDLMLDGEDGLELTRELRREQGMPIVILSARGGLLDRILGLEMGADDYLPKPFNPRELVARIHAVLRRQSPSELPGAPSETSEVFEFGEFALNLATRTLTKAGQEIPLTTGEFSVLKVFARHPRQPLSREKLMELARGREYEVFDRSLDVQISRLRKLIEPDPGSPRFIQTVWGLGYVFIPDGAA